MRSPLNLLLLGLPAAVVLRLLGGPDTLVLAAAAAALVPLSVWIARATEQLAGRSGVRLGGFLNATFANAVELLLAVFALRRGLIDLVKASIIGSIICNTLLTLGLAAIVGGAQNGKQRFRPKAAGRHAAMLILAVSALALPAFAAASQTEPERRHLSISVAAILLATYAAHVVYSQFSPSARETGGPSAPAVRGPAWSLRTSLFVLAGALAFAAVAGQELVQSVEPVSEALGLSHQFLGLVLIPLLGNVAEQVAAVSFAKQNHLNLSLSIAANSSTQIAVFVAPLLVLISQKSHAIDLVFRPIELMTLFGSTGIFAYISLDGESNWLEGVQLVALYLIVGAVFFFVQG